MDFDLNELYGQLVEEISQNVIRKLREQDGSNWPAVETPNESAEVETKDDVPDEVIPDDVEAEDEETPDLTRPEAEAMDLDDLREYALRKGLTKTQLRGLDVDGISDLLFGEREDEEEVELDVETIRDMGFEQLTAIANDPDLAIKIPKGISRGDLAELIINTLS